MLCDSGNGLILNNVATNGGFEQGQGSWSMDNCAVSTELSRSGTHSVKGVNNGSKVLDVYGRFASTTGHIFYIGEFVNLTSYTSGGNSAFYLQCANYAGSAQIGDVVYPNRTTLNTWQLLSTRTALTDGGLYFRTYSVNSVCTFYVDDIYLIDLTATYGAGNEPSKAYMDNLLQQISYFEGQNII